eukprot:5473639-Alexandrium_andersonii.AAC.1
MRRCPSAVVQVAEPELLWVRGGALGHGLASGWRRAATANNGEDGYACGRVAGQWGGNGTAGPPDKLGRQGGAGQAVIRA